MSAGGRDPVDLAALARPNIRGLAPYQAGKPVEELERELGIEGAIKLASNENPLGPSPLGLAAAARAVAGIASYPDAGQTALRRALAASLGVPVGEVFAAGGANELIYLLVQAFCRPGVDEIVTPRFGFVSYRLAAIANDVALRETAVGPDFAPDVDALIAGFGPATRIVFLGQPNNPTGAHLGRAALDRVLAAAPAHAIVVLDEAYGEFARALVADVPDGVELHKAGARPGLVVLRTFSKAFGLAGLRVGYGVACAAIGELVDRARQPFVVNGVAQAAAVAALADADHVARTVAVTRDGMAILHRGLRALGLTTYPSAANFVLVDVGREAEPVYQALLRQGVIVRPLAGWGLPRHLRITVGTAAQCDRAVAALGAVLS